MATLTPQERIAKRRAEDLAKQQAATKAANKATITAGQVKIQQERLKKSGQSFAGGTATEAARLVTERKTKQAADEKARLQEEQRIKFEKEQGISQVTPGDRELTFDEKIAKQTQQSFGETPLTSEQRKQELLSQQASKKDLLDAQIAQQKLAKQQAVDEALTTQEGNRAALLSRFTAAPGGLVASTGEPLAAGITAVQERRIDTFQKQADIQFQQADALKKQLEIAQREQRHEFAADLQRQIAQAEAMAAQAQEGASKAKAEATAETLALQKQEQEANIKAIEVIGDIPASALINMTPEAIEGIANAVGGTISPMLASGYISQAKSVMEDKKLSDEEKLLSVQKLRQDLITSQTSEAQEAIQGIQTIDAQVGINGFTQANADALKASLGFAAAVETPKQKAERLKIEAQTAEITSQVTDTSPQRKINIADTTTGSPLPLGSFGNVQQVTRADRHNNPIANKAYDVTIQRLKDAGLQQGIDFNVGETTEGIDDDGVATIVYSSPEIGVRGAIAGLEAGTIGSWYANPKYAGSKKIQTKLGQLSGQNVTESNAQEVFNNLTAGQQTEVVKTIYGHEGGTQLFKPRDKVTVKLKPKEKVEAEDKLRKESTKLANSIKNFRQFSNNIDIGIDEFINQKAEGGDLSAATQAVIFSFNKLLDEGSVVRESEFARTADGQSLINRLEGGIEQIEQGGAGVTLETIQSVQSIAKKLLGSAESINRDLLIPVRKSAEKQGLDLEAIFSPSTIKLLEEAGINIENQQDFSEMSDDDFVNQGQEQQDNKSFYDVIKFTPKGTEE